jgi:tripartite-type tricarboxylate transporter receptor subunit TctC
LAGRLGQSVTVDNRPGAGSTVGTKAAATAEPDGHTLLQVNSAFAYAQVLYPNTGYDPLTSFSPVASIASWSLLLVVNANLPASTPAELIAHAKARPGEINIGHTLGSPPQVLAEMFKKISGAPLNTVPYREVSLLTSDLLSGRIHVFFGGGAGLVDLVRQGKLKALASTGATRSRSLPSVPTVIESGFPLLAFNPTDWAGIVAPAGTPRTAIDRLNRAISDSLADPEVRAAIATQDAETRISSSSEFAAFIATEVGKWPARVTELGLKPN